MEYNTDKRRDANCRSAKKGGCRREGNAERVRATIGCEGTRFEDWS
jgi:hypothetical protein